MYPSERFEARVSQHMYRGKRLEGPLLAPDGVLGVVRPRKDLAHLEVGVAELLLALLLRLLFRSGLLLLCPFPFPSLLLPQRQVWHPMERWGFCSVCVESDPRWGSTPS